MVAELGTSSIVSRKDARAAQMLASGKKEQFKNIPPPPVFTGKMPSRLGMTSAVFVSTSSLGIHCLSLQNITMAV